MLCLMKCLTNCYLRGSFCSMMLDDDAYFLPTDDVLNCLEEKTNLLDNELNDILCLATGGIGERLRPLQEIKIYKKANLSK